MLLMQLIPFSLTSQRQRAFAARAALVALLLAGSTVRASAQAGFTFNSPNQTATSGTDAVFYDGTLSNGVQPSSLTGYNVNFAIPGAVDASPLEDYFNNTVPDPLPANYGTNLTAFTLAVPYSAATGTYNGTMTMSYLTNGVSGTATQNFSLAVTQTAGFGFTFGSAGQTVTPGGSPVLFGATLDNGSADTTIDGFSFAFNAAPAGLTIDTSPFDTYLNNSDTVSASSHFAQTLFGVSALGTVAAGDYAGTATINYTTNGVGNTALQNFSVHIPTVAVVPEAGSLLLAAGGTLAAAVVVRRRVRGK